MTQERLTENFTGGLLYVETDKDRELVIVKVSNDSVYPLSLNSSHSLQLDRDLLHILDMYGVQNNDYVIDFSNVGYLTSSPLIALSNFRCHKEDLERLQTLKQGGYKRIAIIASPRVQEVFQMAGQEMNFSLYSSLEELQNK